MREQPNNRVTADSLKQWLWNDRPKQEAVAARLLVSVRTIDNWRNGKTIPDQYHAPLLKMMSGEDQIELSLSTDLKRRIAEAAKAKGYKSVEAYVSDILNKLFILMLLGLVGYQVSHPVGDQFARRIGRRRDSPDSVEIMGEA